MGCEKGGKGYEVGFFFFSFGRFYVLQGAWAFFILCEMMTVAMAMAVAVGELGTGTGTGTGGCKMDSSYI